MNVYSWGEFLKQDAAGMQALHSSDYWRTCRRRRGWSEDVWRNSCRSALVLRAALQYWRFAFRWMSYYLQCTTLWTCRTRQVEHVSVSATGFAERYDAKQRRITASATVTWHGGDDVTVRQCAVSQSDAVHVQQRIVVRVLEVTRHDAFLTL